MSGGGVRAVVLPERGGRSPEGTIDALERQTLRPAEVVAGWPAIDQSRGGPQEWLWLLDGAGIPEPDALERLLEAAGALESLASPALLAGKVVRPDGSLDRLALPVPTDDPELAVGAFERHVLALRAARRGSLLVRRSAIEATGLRPGRRMPGGDDLLWTARLMREEAGFLAPASVMVRAPGSRSSERRRAWAGLADWTRLVVSDALERSEKPWFAFRLAEEAAGALRAR